MIDVYQMDHTNEPEQTTRKARIYGPYTHSNVRDVGFRLSDRLFVGRSVGEAVLVSLGLSCQERTAAQNGRNDAEIFVKREKLTQTSTRCPHSFYSLPIVFVKGTNVII